MHRLCTCVRLSQTNIHTHTNTATATDTNTDADTDRHTHLPSNYYLQKILDEIVQEIVPLVFEKQV